MGSDLDKTAADDNVIQPFQLESSNLRGRVVRVGSVINEVLEPHGYPNPIAHLVAEAMTVTLLLSSMLKYEGIFTLQAQGDGPVSTLVADVTTGGEVRGCATFDAERLQHSREQLSALKAEESSRNHLAQYLGKGYLAFTVDQGKHTDRYQGIVELKGSSIVDCVQHYFNQSEQIGSGIKMAAGKRGELWRAGAIMLQHMPEDEKNPEAGAGNMNEDDWRRSMILLDTCTEDELLDPALHSNELLTRLFHEEGVRVFEPIAVTKGCRCNVDKVRTIVTKLPPEDIEHIAVNGKIEMHCEFCSKDFVFDLNDIRATVETKTT
ncbi:MAG: Hsp33 family molecular chaperone HslO [Alphaproteobacteria bacterium]|nr:Hsp33 family molecular chaperone HslO [Alphaproteobacteria bacterium]